MGLLNFTREPVPEAVSADLQLLNQLSAQVAPGVSGRGGGEGGAQPVPRQGASEGGTPPPPG